jgi:UDP-N-acetylglucosamine acyltransferase
MKVPGNVEIGGGATGSSLVESPGGSSNSNVVAIHPTAVIDSGAIIGKGTTIGPYCVIDGNVVIGDNCKLIAHVHVTGHTTIGPRTVISAFASLGAPPQSVSFRGGPTRLVVGADCDVRQSVTMNAGTEDGGGITEVGDRGFFMANCHVGHDCHVGNDVVMANCATLGGHCLIGDHVFIGGLSAVHQHTRIGAHAMIGGVSGVREDVIPFGLAAGSFARLSGINVVGMKRRTYSGEAIRATRLAYRLIFFGKDVMARCLDDAESKYGNNEAVAQIVAFIRSKGRRAICHPGNSNEGS